VDKQKQKKRIKVAGVIASSVMLIFILFAAWNPLNKWQLKLADRLYEPTGASDEIVIVAIDEKSVSERSVLGRWEKWDRVVYAQLIENLERAGARVIAFDVIFSEEGQGISAQAINMMMQRGDYENQVERYAKSPHPSDEIFSEVLEKYSNVILGKGGVENPENSQEIMMGIEPILLLSKHAHEAWLKAFFDEDEVVRRFYSQFYDVENEEWGAAFSKKIVEVAGYNVEEIPDEVVVNYSSEPYGFQRVSFVDAYNGDWGNINVANKIVLVGATSERLKDNFLTPVSNGEAMPGVEIHANAIQTILEGSYLQEQSLVSQILLIALIAIALTVATLFTGVIPGFLIAAGGLGLYHWGLAPFAFKQGLILNLVYPTLALFFAYLITTLYKTLVESREKMKLKGAFMKYVNKDLVGQILNNPEALKLGGAKRNITVFFSDIANFTHFSESVTPEELVAQLNDYFEVMAGIILESGGTLDKYEGDAIMAYWGAPLDQPDHALRGVNSALKCRQALTQLHEKWAAEGRPLLDFRVGLASGDAIAGNVGSQERFDYTVMGDIVNLGSRLEGANKVYGTQVLISDQTAAQLGDAFTLQRVDRLRVKGKDQPVDVYTLVTDHNGWLGEYHQAIEYYRNAKFEEAEARFNKATELNPSDGPIQVYLKRCAHLKANPPQEGWDGTWTLDHK